MSFKDLMAKERSLRQKTGSESSNPQVKSCSAAASSTTGTDAKKK